LSYQRDFAERINVGIIGIGSHGYRNILPLMNYLPVKVKAVCNRTADVGRATAAQYGCAHGGSVLFVKWSEKLDKNMAPSYPKQVKD